MRPPDFDLGERLNRPGSPRHLCTAWSDFAPPIAHRCAIRCSQRSDGPTKRNGIPSAPMAASKPAASASPREAGRATRNVQGGSRRRRLTGRDSRERSTSPGARRTSRDCAGILTNDDTPARPISMTSPFKLSQSGLERQSRPILIDTSCILSMISLQSPTIGCESCWLARMLF